MSVSCGVYVNDIGLANGGLHEYLVTKKSSMAKMQEQQENITISCNYNTDPSFFYMAPCNLKFWTKSMQNVIKIEKCLAIF